MSEVIEFKCLHSGKCCEKVFTQISLTVGDLIRISKFLKVPVSELFKEHVGMNPFKDPSKGNFYEYEIGLNIPCRFRKNKQCTIYEARPLNCRLFPYWILAEVPEERIKEIVDESYECVHRIKINEKTKEKYKKYKDAVVDLLFKEGALTDKIMKRLNFKHSIKPTKKFPEPDLNDLESIKKLEVEKIKYCIKILDKDKFKELPELLEKEIKENKLDEKNASLDDMKEIEKVLC